MFNAGRARRGRGARRHRSRGRARFVRLADRSVGVREEHAPPRHRRSRRADRGHRRGQRQARAPRPSRPRLRHGVPAGRACSTGGPSSATSSCRSSCRAGRPPTAGHRAEELLKLVRLDEFAEHRPVAAVGRHAAARRDRAGAVGAPVAAAHGRAVRRPRRDDPGAHAGRAAPDLRRHRHHRRLRHALDPRGGVPVRRVVVMSARPGRITTIVDVDLGRRTDETREDPTFFAFVTQVREALRAGHEPAHV